MGTKVASRNRRSVAPLGAIFHDTVPAGRQNVPSWMRKPEPGASGASIPPETAAALLHVGGRPQRPARKDNKGREGTTASSADPARSLPDASGETTKGKVPPADPLLEARIQSAALAAEANESWLPPAGENDVKPAPAVDLTELQLAISSLHRERSSVLEQTEPQLLELCRNICERVLAGTAPLLEELAARLTREGLHVLDHNKQVVVILGPGFAAQAGELQSNLERDGITAEVQVHEQLSEYACQVRSELGAVDESLESRLDHVLSTFTELREKS